MADPNEYDMKAYALELAVRANAADHAVDIEPTARAFYRFLTGDQKKEVPNG